MTNTTTLNRNTPHPVEEAHVAVAAFLARYSGRTLDAYRLELRDGLVECVDADDLVLPALLQEPDIGTTRRVEELAPLRGVALVPGCGIPTCELVGSGRSRAL